MNHKHIALSLALTMALAAGSAQAASSPRDARPASVTRSLDLTTADHALIAAGYPAAHDFAALDRPGIMTRSGAVLVQVKSHKAMQQTAADRLIRSALAAQPLGKPAARPNITPEQIRAEATSRIESARARLMPALRKTIAADLDRHSVFVPAGWDEEAFADFLMATGDYASVEPDWILYPTLTPNDPLYSQQYHHQTNHLNTHAAWNFTTGDASMIVAVCDTGIDIDHPDLANRVLGFNAVNNTSEADGGSVADQHGHGSSTSGCAAAVGNNGVGVTGMGWGFSLMPIKVAGPDGGAPFGDLEQGALWAANNGAKVINVSYSGGGSSTVTTLGNNIRNKGAILVWASGNEGQQSVNAIQLNTVIAGASNQSAVRAGFSNYGNGMDILAPGVDVRTTNRWGSYTYSTGTSFSAPLTAGGLGLIWAANTDLTADQVQSLLYEHAKDKGTPGWDFLNGWGLADIGASVEAAFNGEVRLPVPFTENFDDGSLQSIQWPENTGAILTTDAINEPTGDSSLKFDDTDTVSTGMLDASGVTPGSLTLRMAVQGEPGDGSLDVEYEDLAGIWQSLFTVADGDAAAGVWRYIERTIPTWALHDSLKLRMSFSGGAGADHLFVDEFRLDETEDIHTFWLENFEQAPDPAVWPVFDGSYSTAASDTPSGTGSARFAQGDVAETKTILTRNMLLTQVGFDAYISYWVQPENLEAGDSLLVEWYDAVSTSWQTLETIDAGDVSDSSFTLRQTLMPFGMIAFLDSKLRFTAQTNAADDVWYIDNIYVGGEQFSQPNDCPVDFTGDGIVDAGDLSAFITMYLASDLGVDLTGDGIVDAGDLSAFITQYLAAVNNGGTCP